MRKPRKVAPDPSHPRSQEKHTLWRSTSTFLINTSRGEPGYKRDVCDAQMTSRPFFALIHKINIRCLLLRGRSHEQGMRPWNIMVELCPGPWFDQMKTEIGKSVWNESEGGGVRSKKQTGWDTVDHWHARGGGLLSNDWLEDKKTGLHYKRDVCDALVVSRPWNVCLQ